MKRPGMLALAFACFTCSGLYAQQPVRCTPNDPVLAVLQEELARDMAALQKEEYPPYYMNFRLVDETGFTMRSIFGTVMGCKEEHKRYFAPQIRIGTPEFDNFKMMDQGSAIMGMTGPVAEYSPLDYDLPLDGLRVSLWEEVCARYKNAVAVYNQMKQMSGMMSESEDKAPCFSPAPAECYYERRPMQEEFAGMRKAWEDKLNVISAVFKGHPEIIEGKASIYCNRVRTWFVSTENASVVQNTSYNELVIEGMSRAEDGMYMPFYIRYTAASPDGFPSADKLLADAKQMVADLIASAKAPLADPFNGPVLLSGASSAAFFQEVVTPKFEGHRIKRETDGKVFKGMVGHSILPASISISDDPQAKEFMGFHLTASYLYDEQGVKAQKVKLVENGKLNDFLMSRKPIDGHPASNGHGRASFVCEPVSSQSNLLVTTTEKYSEQEMRELYLAELRAEGLEYGYYFKRIIQAVQNDSGRGVNSFILVPQQVYRVYADGRPDELVRGIHLIGTPLVIMSNIAYAGGDYGLFNGYRMTEAGYLQVSTVAPSIIVRKTETQRRARETDLPPILPRP